MSFSHHQSAWKQRVYIDFPMENAPKPHKSTKKQNKCVNLYKHAKNIKMCLVLPCIYFLFLDINILIWYWIRFTGCRQSPVWASDVVGGAPASVLKLGRFSELSVGCKCYRKIVSCGMTQSQTKKKLFKSDTFRRWLNFDFQTQIRHQFQTPIRTPIQTPIPATYFGRHFGHQFCW